MADSDHDKCRCADQCPSDFRTSLVERSVGHRATGTD